MRPSDEDHLCRPKAISKRAHAPRCSGRAGVSNQREEGSPTNALLFPILSLLHLGVTDDRVNGPCHAP
eukprot:7950220-Alexandrium_andersonii.AAC.1